MELELEGKTTKSNLVFGGGFWLFLVVASPVFRFANALQKCRQQSEIKNQIMLISYSTEWGSGFPRDLGVLTAG